MRHLKRYTFMVMSPARGQVRQFKIAKALIVLIFAVCLGSVCLGGYGLYVKFTTSEDRDRLSGLLQENRVQEEQIKSIATEMDTLKGQLVRLHQMDRRIRIIANLEQGPSGVELQGMGGVKPDESVLQSLGRERKERWVGRIREELELMQDFAGEQEWSLQSLEEDLREKQELLTHTPAIWPTKGWLTSRFGYRQSPFTGMREFHPGVDVATRHGTPVIAPAGGMVMDIGRAAAPGRFIRIDHGFGYRTYYAHLDNITVEKGERVERGQVLATVGNTGRSTGPHLHYEILVKGLPVNPLRYILD
jgi:murein DD-endopeptidase MepM/ murein hydrolase activator NlpD